MQGKDRKLIGYGRLIVVICLMALTGCLGIVERRTLLKEDINEVRVNAVTLRYESAGDRIRIKPVQIELKHSTDQHYTYTRSLLRNKDGDLADTYDDEASVYPCYTDIECSGMQGNDVDYWSVAPVSILYFGIGLVPMLYEWTTIPFRLMGGEREEIIYKNVASDFGDLSIRSSLAHARLQINVAGKSADLKPEGITLDRKHVLRRWIDNQSTELPIRITQASNSKSVAVRQDESGQVANLKAAVFDPLVREYARQKYPTTASFLKLPIKNMATEKPVLFYQVLRMPVLARGADGKQAFPFQLSRKGDQLNLRLYNNGDWLTIFFRRHQGQLVITGTDDVTTTSPALALPLLLIRFMDFPGDVGVNWNAVRKNI